MFYRSIALVLAVTTVLAIRLSDSSAIAFTTSQSTEGSTVAEHPSSSALGDKERKLETVVVSIPTPFVNEMPAEPDFAVLKSNHSMLLEASSTVPVNMHSISATASDALPVDIEPVPTLAPPVTKSVVTHPIYDAAPIHSSAPTWHAPVSEYVAPTYYENQHVVNQHVVNQHVVDQHVVEYPPIAPHAAVQAPIHHVAPNAIYHSNHVVYPPAPASTYPAQIPSHPALNTENYGLFQYRRMMMNHSAPHPQELQGTWQGINKGVATLAIDKRFIKEFKNVNGQIYGDNIDVQQGSGGWDPIQDPNTGDVKRQGKFLVQRPGGIGPFGHGVVLNYSKGGNRKLDPANLISDQLVKLDDNHMLGRATAKFGPIRIPLAYFVIQRVPE